MKRLAISVLALGCVAAFVPAANAATDDCAAEWNKADTDRDGVLTGVEANEYLAYLRVRAQVAPQDGRITQDRFIEACKGDLFKVEHAEPAAPIKGANSFTEGQAKDRAVAAGVRQISVMTKDDDGIWRGKGKKGDQDVAVAVDFKGNVVFQ